MVTLEKAIELLQEHKSNGKGRIFTVVFKKRTTGEIRVMNCRFEVKSALKGGTLRYVPREKNLMVVYDMQKQAYRSINLEDILELLIDGKQFMVGELEVQ